MGMTIDEHKEHLLDIMDSMPDDACGDWRDSLAYAIETMRKYQKIEQILQEPCIIPVGCHLLQEPSIIPMRCYPMLKKIEEVVEDGKID